MRLACFVAQEQWALIGQLLDTRPMFSVAAASGTPGTNHRVLEPVPSFSLPFCYESRVLCCPLGDLLDNVVRRSGTLRVNGVEVL